MTAKPPTTTEERPTPVPEPGERELVELAKQFPAFDYRETAVDRFWLDEEQAKGNLDSLYGKVVAVYNKQIIGVGDNYVTMLLQLSPQYNVSPGRIVVVYLGE